jgi:AraC-like DNA-binding protein
MLTDKSNHIECHFSDSMDTIDKRYTAHPQYEIFLLLEGDVTMLINSQRYMIKNGALVLLTSRDLHISMNNAPRTYKRITVMFDPHAIRQFNTEHTNLLDCFSIAASKQRNILYLSAEQIQTVQTLADPILTNGRSDRFGDDITVLTSLLSLLIFINRLYRSHLPKIAPIPLTPIIREIVDYVDSHIDEELSVQSLCHHFSYSVAYISAQFSKQMGLPLKQFIITKKIALAKQLLAESLSVTQVYERCGFGDYSNFIRTFKKTVGISPLQWQKWNQTS